MSERLDKRVLTTLLVSLLFGCGGGTASGAGGTGGGTGGTGGIGDGGTGGTGGSGGADVELPAEQVEVTFPAEGLDLVGTLHLPARREGERVPAVVLAHGSGPNSRDEEMGGQLNMLFGFIIEVFAELAEALADAGYAVLRYDKRTCGWWADCANDYPWGTWVGEDVYAFIGDVESALDFLASRDDIDPARLFFAGHSAGGGFAPELLTRRGELRAAVMLAGPFFPIDEGMAAQVAFTREQCRELGMTEETIDAALADLDRLVSQLAALRAGTFAGLEIDGYPTESWREWMRLGDEAPGLARALDRPILALSGDYDWNVPPIETERWGELFAERSPPLQETKLLPCITHALNCVSQPDWTQIRPADIGRHIDAAVLDAVIDFLDRAP